MNLRYVDRPSIELPNWHVHRNLAAWWLADSRNVKLHSCHSAVRMFEAQDE